MQIYRPDGEVGPPPVSLASAVPTMAGLRLGILDNNKPNAGVLLNRMAEGLTRRTGATLAVVETKNAALAAPDEVMGKLTKEVDLVLTGSAD